MDETGPARCRVGSARWAKWVAYAAALTPVPSGLWRIALGFGLLTGLDEAWLREMDIPGSGTVYVIVLSLVTEALALLTLGLVYRWGEVVPRWIPVVGGRTVPVHAVAVPAALGAIVLTAPATHRWSPGDRYSRSSPSITTCAENEAAPKGHPPVITGICEATPRQGMLEELRDFLVRSVRDFPERYPGFLGDEILVGEDCVLYVSRWQDESALENYAGAQWRDRPVVLPAEERLLGTMRIRHFSAVSPAR